MGSHLQIDSENSLGFLIADIARLLREQFNQTAQVLGLTQAQARALVHLNRNEGISQTALAQLLEIQPITLLRQIDRLAEAGLVQRRPNPADRRAQQLYLTAEAGDLMQDITRLGTTLTDAAFADFSTDDRELAISLLQQIKRNLAGGPPATATARDTLTKTSSRQAMTKPSRRTR